MRNRDRRVRNIPVSQIIPNMITSGSIFCGVSSMIMTYRGLLIPAAVMIWETVSERRTMVLLIACLRVSKSPL